MRSAHRRHASTRGLDPTKLAWSHVYWTDGNRFKALGLANGAAVTSWPDEAATADLAAAGAQRPLIVTSNASFSGKTTVRFDGQDDRMSFDWTDIPAPYEIYVVVKRIADTAVGGNNVVLDNFGGGTQLRFYSPGSPGQWDLSSSASDLFGSAADNNLHTFRLVVAAGASATSFFKDEVSQASGNITAPALTGLLLGARGAQDRFGNYDFAFVGVMAGSLTAQNRTDLHTWAQTFYGAP